MYGNKSGALKSKAGDKIFLEPSKLGLTIAVLPANPPFDPGIVDFFSHGLKFTSLARMRAALQSGIPFESDDKNFVIRSTDGEVVMEFRPSDLPGMSFKVGCDQETSEQLIQTVDGHLAGEIVVSSNHPRPKRGLREGEE